MIEVLQTHRRSVRLFYLWSGIIATLAYRVIIVLNNWGKIWVQVAWYIGTIGFIIYFIHRWQVATHRRRVIDEYALKSKVQLLDSWPADDRQAISYILESVATSKEKWNDIFLFITSALALAVGIYLDLLR